MTSSNVEVIIANFKKAYPDDSILVYEFETGGACSYVGEKLLDVNLDSGKYLQIWKLSKSSGSYMDSDTIKAKVFPFIYETKNITDGGQGRNILRDKFKNLFPDHYVNVFIFGNSAWSR